MKWMERRFERRATAWLKKGLDVTLYHYQLIRREGAGGSTAPLLLSLMIRVAKDAAKDEANNCSAVIRAGLQGELGKREERIARLEQFHCEHVFSEVEKGCLESILCAKCGAVNPAWRVVPMPTGINEEDREVWRILRCPRDRRAIYVKNDGYYVPVAPPEEAP